MQFIILTGKRFWLYNVFLPFSLEFASRSAPVRSDDEMSVKTEYQDFDPAKHNPVFYGKMHERVEADEDVMKELDAATSHPSCAGYTFTDKPPETPPSPPPTPPHKDVCKYRISSIWLKTRLFAQLKSSSHLQWSGVHSWPSIDTSGLSTLDGRMMWECANVDYCTRLCDSCDVHKLIKWFNFHKSEYVVFMIIEKECLVIRQLQFECDPWKTIEQCVDLMNIQDILAVL